MATMRELFSKVFAYVLLFEQSLVSGQAQRSYAQVRGDIKRLLDQHQPSDEHRDRLEQYQAGKFAVVAWVDETILRLTSWEHVNRWRASPLQLELYDMQIAGQEFFQRLPRLRPDQKEIREIYYLALGLGFKGQYFRGGEDERTLAQIRREQAQHLPLSLVEVERLDKLTPQPYDVPPPPPPPPPPTWPNWLPKAGLALLVSVPLVLWLILVVWRPVPQFQLTVHKSGNGTVTSTDKRINCGTDCVYKDAKDTAIVLQAVPEAGAVFSQWRGDPDCADGKITLTVDISCTAVFDRKRRLDEDIRKEIVDHMAPQPCAKITVAVQAGVVSLSGRVASETQRGEVRGIARGTEDVTQVDDTLLEIIPRPFCRVLDLLEPLRKHGQKHHISLTMHLDRRGHHPVYVENDNLILDIKTPTPFASYLYVDWYTADPQLMVGHLVPNWQDKVQPLTQPLGRGTNLVVDIKNFRLSIQAPFGLELMTVIASKTPLFATPRSKETEDADAYLDALSPALQSKGEASDVTAEFSFFITRKQ